MSTNWQIGDRIKGRWEIHKIFKGGMGDVYVVYDHQWREALAIKTFQDEVFEQDPTIADRFRQEALTWVNLDAHENVTRARMVETIDGKPFLFLEYVAGGDLGNWIGTPRLVDDLPQVLRFAIQFCDGMTHALSHGIKAHRDIKPANCLITQDKKLQVTDFGLARVFEEGPQEPVANHVAAGEPKPERGTLLKRLFGKQLVSAPPASAVVSSDRRVATRVVTQTGIGAGTPPYMAPEQFDDFKRVDVRGDIYSFGIMLFEMVTGRLPFVGRSWEEYKHLHQTQPAPLLSSQAAILNEIVQDCLAKDPTRRSAEFAVVRQQLAKVYERIAGQPLPQPATAAELSAAEWSNKGACLENLGRPVDALACYDRALEIDPLDAMAWDNKGDALDNLGRYTDALACYDRALEIDPRDAVAWDGKGVDLARLGGLADALACFDRALEINPRDEKAWYNKGKVLYDLDRLEDALTCFDRALEFDPRIVAAWYNKGGALANLGRPADALACFDRVLKIDPRNANAWFNRGNTLKRLGRLEDAIACYDRALEIDSRNAIAWCSKGFVLASLDRPADAVACYDRALEIDPLDALAWNNKGVALGMLGRLEAALACAESAHQLGHPRAGETIELIRRQLRSK